MSRLIRQIHRWLAIAFTLGVITNTGRHLRPRARKQPAFWVYLLALIPLFALLFSGLYLFFLPYFAAGRRAAAAVQS
jgi:quinol-cytochrome oxidoreductase complex cytochrome b subunit